MFEVDGLGGGEGGGVKLNQPGRQKSERIKSNRSTQNVTVTYTLCIKN